MARQKVIAEPTLRNWEDVDCALREIGEINGRVAIAKAKANKIIKTQRDRLKATTQDDLVRKEMLSQYIREYADYHKQEFSNKRHRKVNHGAIGYRETSKVVVRPKYTMEQVLALTKAARKKRFIRTRCELDKEAIHAANLAADDLEKLGIAIATTDKFWYRVEVVKPKSTK